MCIGGGVELAMASPVCLSMVLCDTVLRDLTTNKCTIVGTYNTVFIAEFPAAARLGVFCELTDGNGQSQLELQVVEAATGLDDESGDPVVKHGPIPIDLPSPLHVVEVATAFIAKFQRPGLYYCELLANGNPIASRRIVVQELKKEQ